MTLGDDILSLIRGRIERMNTLAIATVLRPRAGLRADVLLKHLIDGLQVELKDLPVAPAGCGETCLYVAPAAGDVVLVGFTKYERDQQLLDGSPAEVDPLSLYGISNAVILAGIPTAATAVPTLAPGEMVLQHRSGSGLWFHADGKVTLKTEFFTVSGIE